MLTYYKVFVSYRCLTKNVAILGNNIKVTVAGIGTAVYRLNGKVIKTINALHIPAL